MADANKMKGIITAAIILLSLTGVAAHPALAGTGSVVYTYDALGRLLTASYDTGVIVIYSYDANGNRTSQTINVNTATLGWDNTGGPPVCPAGNVCTWGSALW